MADVMVTDRAAIEDIVGMSSRLRYLLTVSYAIAPETISAIRVDGDNFKIDVHAGDEIYRFKAKGLEEALLKDPETGGLKLVLDPALAQAIYAIVGEYAGS